MELRELSLGLVIFLREWEMAKMLVYEGKEYHINLVP